MQYHSSSNHKIGQYFFYISDYSIGQYKHNKKSKKDTNNNILLFINNIESLF